MIDSTFTVMYLLWEKSNGWPFVDRKDATDQLRREGVLMTNHSSFTEAAVFKRRSSLSLMHIMTDHPTANNK